MHWLALHWPELAGAGSAWLWRALRFTPRVARVEEALLLEVSTCERLWGGRDRLVRRFLGARRAATPAGCAQAATSLIALALLRWHRERPAQPPPAPPGLPLHTLSAARPHLATLARAGVTTWGQLRALPRAGVARRFGAGLLDALDAALGERPESYPWLTLPDTFDEALELPALATSAPELLWAARHLLDALQAWLRARQRGVLAIELEWTLDLRRLNGAELPPTQQLVVRTARPTQGVAHLRRLLGEQLARVALAAPANHLRLRALETAPWAGSSTSLLPEDLRQGERLHELVERLSIRLGADQVRVPVAQADHRPERMQVWQPAAGAAPAPACAPGPALLADALYPVWLLPEPLPLQVVDEVPHYQGPLHRLTRLQRVETGWWEDGQPALRDYFIARSPQAGLLWIFRERPLSLARGLEGARQFRWFLQGRYA